MLLAAMAAASQSASAEDLTSYLLAVSHGDSAALESLYQRTSAKLFGVCLRILRERSEAEEVLQETYVTVWRRAGAFDPARASAITWLVAVARNKAIDRLRSGRMQRQSVPVETIESYADDAPTAETLLEESDERRRLLGCLETLEPEQRSCIREAFFEAKTYEELAQQRAMPLGTMKSWIRRSLLKLRGCLGE